MTLLFSLSNNLSKAQTENESLKTDIANLLMNESKLQGKYRPAISGGRIC